MGVPTRTPPDRALAQLAARQHGVIARRQASAAGVSSKAIEVRLRAGRLIPLHRGVYALGHRRLRSEGYWMAAVLAVGPGAVLSHREAAALHGLRPTNRARIDVTTEADRCVPGIEVHRVRRLDPADVTTVSGIPVTTVARTLVDLADVVNAESLAKAMDEAERQNRLDLRAIHTARTRTTGRNGPGPQRLTHALRELAAHGTTLTRSPLEVAFQALINRAGLPKPRTNARLKGHEVDAYWPDHKLAVELDGWRFHNTRRDFQRDRERDRELTAAGHKVIRFTHRDVHERPAHVVETLRRLGL
jgi:very-short-patch-repair endonuclease